MTLDLVPDTLPDPGQVEDCRRCQPQRHGELLEPVHSEDNENCERNYAERQADGHDEVIHDGGHEEDGSPVQHRCGLLEGFRGGQGPQQTHEAHDDKWNRQRMNQAVGFMIMVPAVAAQPFISRSHRVS